MEWQEHGSFGGRQAVSPSGKEYLVIPNCETGKWEVWAGGFKESESWHTQTIAIAVAELAADAEPKGE